jgi:dienelactone hydrolase
MIAALVAFAVTAAAAAEAGGDRPEPFQARGNAAVAGMLSLPWPHPEVPVPAVVILPDALGPDGRADAYALALAAAGLLVLEVDAASVAEAAGLGATPAGLAAAAALVVRELARDPRVLPGRIGVLGFGAGGRAALLAPAAADGSDGIAARAILYPGCIGLGAAAGAAPVLLLHGDSDPANPAAHCALVRAERIELAGAGYAWDRPTFAAEGPALLPRPDGAGRVRSIRYPLHADRSANQVADWLARALSAGAPHDR